MGSFRYILENLKTQIELEVARPVNGEGSGGTPFAVDVLIGDDKKSLLPGENGRVVLSLYEDSEDAIAPCKELNAKLRALCTWQPMFSARLWVPVGAAGERTYLGRLDAIEALGRCVIRSLHEKFHGANATNAQIAEGATVVRTPTHLRHGEAAIVLFTVGAPITKGRGLAQLSPGSRLAVTLNVNPES